MRVLDERLVFPAAESANDDGVVALGGDLEPERLLLAYRSGIFPWPVEGYPLLWFSPDPRCVLEPHKLHISRSLQKLLRTTSFRISFDEAFDEVIQACASTPRRHERGTWITEHIKRAYGDLHRLGHAHSVEVWQEGELIGGTYGVAIGRAFAGESMFHKKSNASKIALVALVMHLAKQGCQIIDCQMKTPMLTQFGAELWPRALFLKIWKSLCSAPAQPGTWKVTNAPVSAVD